LPILLHLLRALKLLAVATLIAAGMLAALSTAPPRAQAPLPALRAAPEIPAEVRFMRAFVQRVNPSLAVEDPLCATVLPGAIHHYARAQGLDWRPVLALAWQESDFDCHAKNRSDKGGAYGPFQIRRLWEPVIGDPRPLYYDPELAVERVVQVIRYYRDSERYRHLMDRGFRNPLLCLYNTGESRRRVNMGYCRRVGAKLQAVREAWAEFQADESRQARNGAARVPTG
jgi:hypothetical protein